MRIDNDCRDCIRHGGIHDGKLECGIEGIVEPINGEYPHAENCAFYEDVLGNMNEEPKNCPLCGGKVIIWIGLKGATIICSTCDLRLGIRSTLTTKEAIKAWNRRV